VLFNNENNAVSGAITLSDSAANYSRITVYGRTTDTTELSHCSTDIYNPNGKTFTLVTAIYGKGNIWLKTRTYEINGTTINTPQLNGVYPSASAGVTGSGGISTDDPITITQVLGWR
jgi:hypothetical protein